MNMSTILSLVGSAGSTLASLFTAVLGASPWGLGALGVVVAAIGIGAPIFWNKLMAYLNAKTDATDQANAGADAGNTAVDITNQAVAVRQGLDGLQAANPPAAPVAPVVATVAPEAKP